MRSSARSARRADGRRHTERSNGRSVRSRARRWLAMKPKIRSKNKGHREEVLGELELLALGRHASQQTVLERYRQCSDWKQASVILSRALDAGQRRGQGSCLTPPAGWLPPTL